MKRIFGFLTILFLISMPAFAAKNSADVTFGKAIKVGSTQVPAGRYKISWTGTDSDAKLTISQSGKTITTVPARIEAHKNGYVGNNTTVINGVEVLQTIQLNNLNLVLTSPTSVGE
jgi:hypothetical protein